MKPKSSDSLRSRKRGHATDLTQKAIALAFAQQAASPRNTALLALSLGAGLRARELAALTFEMVLDENGEISETLVLPDWAAKMGSGGLLPLAPKVRDALANLRSAYPNAEPCDPLFVSQKTRKALTRQAIVDGMRRIWRQAGIDASSHSGRRYFITQAARHISLCGGSLEDVRSLARHTALSTTQLYIAQNTKAQRDVVALVGKMLRVA